MSNSHIATPKLAGKLEISQTQRTSEDISAYCRTQSSCGNNRSAGISGTAKDVANAKIATLCPRRAFKSAGYRAESAQTLKKCGAMPQLDVERCRQLKRRIGRCPDSAGHLFLRSVPFVLPPEPVSLRHGNNHTRIPCRSDHNDHHRNTGLQNSMSLRSADDSSLSLLFLQREQSGNDIPQASHTGTPVSHRQEAGEISEESLSYAGSLDHRQVLPNSQQSSRPDL